MVHKNYYELTAKDTYDLGVQKGELFGEFARATLAKRKNESNWLEKIELGKTEFDLTNTLFPAYIDEIEGYAKASHISVPEFWTLSLEDDFDYIDEKCTTVVTNNGKLIAHNEDWEKGAQENICLLMS